MNIILVIFDSLRKDCVGVYGSPPWGKVHTPHFDAFAKESLVMTRAFPESLPTLPTRRAIYTGRRVYPFHRWWFNCKADGTGVLLYDLEASDPFARNVADGFHDVVNDLYAQAIEDARGGFPDWIVELATDQADAPGCSDLVARV